MHRGSEGELLALAGRALALKEEPRQGWLLRGVRAPESVADHSWGTALLCLLFARSAGVDAGRAVAIALVHDLAEVETGDLIARADDGDREVSLAHKAELELAAMARLLPAAAGEVRELWQAYEERTDAEARFVRDMNLIEMCLQAAIYQEQQRYDPAVTVASRGAFTHLDEFFASAESRLEGELARRLFALLWERYQAAR